MTTVQIPAAPTTVRVCTRSLLTCAVVAAPLWATVALTQAATREGFDLTRHPLSSLSNGDLGWLQITNFLVYGVLLTAGAVGLRRVLGGASRWAPRFLALSAAGMFAGGVFVMDPPAGFPLGTPASTTMSGSMVGHMLAGTVAFAALAAACVALGRVLARDGERRLALVSYAAAALVVLGDGWATAGAPLGSLTIAVGVIPAMLWVALLAARYRRTV